MSDPRYHNGTVYKGAPVTQQQALNQRHRRFCDNHPASYGWIASGVTPDGLVIWQKDGALLRRHPAGDCWLLHWAECWQPIDKHISQLSEELETIKTQIEFEIAKEEFTAAAETLAA